VTRHSVLYGTPDPTETKPDVVVSALESTLDGADVVPVTTVDGCRAELTERDARAVVLTEDFEETTLPDAVASIREDHSSLPLVLYTERPAASLVAEVYDAGITAVVDRESPASARILAETLHRDPPAERATEERADATAEAGGYHDRILDTIGDGVYALDGEERFVAVNDAYADLTGFRPEELLGEPSSLVTDGLGGDGVAGVQQALDEEGEAVTFETDLPTVDGQTVPVEARITPLIDDSGAVGRVGVVRDVSERKRLEHELEHVLERVTDAFFALDTDWTFTYVNDRASELLQRDRSELVGESVWEAFPEAADTAFQAQYERAMTTGESVTFEEFYLPLEAWFEVSAYPSATGLSVYFRDVTDRKRNERRREDRVQRFEALNDRARRLNDAETPEAVCEMTVEAATSVLGLDAAYVTLYDETSGELTVAAGEEGSVVTDPSLFDAVSDGPVWDAFVRGEQTVVTDVQPTEEADASIRSLAAFPLGEHGVFVTTSPAPDAFVETDLLVAELLCANARSALDRAAREADLHRQRDQLEKKNDRLERVNRINRAVREILGVLVRADSYEEVERLVCEKLAAIDPFRFVWIGHPDGANDTVRPVAAAGDEQGYLDVVTATADASAPSQCPASLATQRRSPAVENRVIQVAGTESWREAALSRGFQSVVSVPICHRETLYGVLTIYSGTPGTFETMEVTALEELGQSIGYAASAIERKRALVGEESVELTLHLPALETPFLGFLDGEAGRFELENVVRRVDGRVNLFLTAEGLDFETVRAAAAEAPAVDGVSPVSTDGQCLFECTLGQSMFVAAMLDRGVAFEGLSVDEAGVEMRLRVPHDTDVRGLVRYVEETLGRVDLVSRREVDTPVLSRGEFENEIHSQFTDRQREVLETAYFAGFFDWPRQSNGQEVAELLDVTQPTVNRHVRAGERRIFELLFEGLSDEE